jgi:hypothetical protein
MEDDIWCSVFQRSYYGTDHRRTSVTIEELSGDLVISTTEENIERVHAMVLNNWWVTIDEVVHCMHVSHASVDSFKTGLSFIKFVQDGFQNNSQKSRPRPFWQFAKACWTAVITKMTLFRLTVIGDETWLHHYAPGSKSWSMEWEDGLRQSRSSELNHQQEW